MKKILFTLTLVIAAAVMMTSCSKEYTLNADLNGSWNMTTLNEATVSNYGLFTFVKSSETKGNVTMIYTWGNFSVTHTGTYVLTSDTKITVTPDDGSDVMIYTVISHSSKDLKIKQESNGDVMVFAKK